MRNSNVLLFILLFVVGSCVKDKPNPSHYQIPNATHHGVIICNEGSYGNNNGELSFIDIDQNAIYNQLYKTANSKSPGDIVQSITEINQQYYVAVNHSNKICVLNKSGFIELTSINSIQSPRYISQVSGSKAYVSCLYYPRIYVIDLTTNTLLKTISVDFPNTERMLVSNGFCYVTNWDIASAYLYKIDISKDSIVQKISLNCKASHEIVQDKNGMLWILSGNKYKNTQSFLSQFNPFSEQLIQTIPFAQDADPIRLCLNSTKDTLYFINVNYSGSANNNGLYKMGIGEHHIPSTPFIRANTNSYFWALGIDSSSQHIFISDPKGFTQQSTVYEFDSNGLLLREYTAGIGANYFLFK